jgi:hypothetical protein
MLESSKKHLRESRTTYLEHLKFAIYAGVLLFIAAISSFIHSIIPAFFKGTAAFIVIKLYKQRLENHPNQIYQGYINNENYHKTNIK